MSGTKQQEKKKTYAQNYIYCTQSRAIALILYRKNFNYGAKSVSNFFFFRCSLFYGNTVVSRECLALTEHFFQNRKIFEI